MIGIDSSAEMIEQASALGDRRVRLRTRRHRDLATRPPTSTSSSATPPCNGSRATSSCSRNWTDRAAGRRLAGLAGAGQLLVAVARADARARPTSPRWVDRARRRAAPRRRGRIARRYAELLLDAGWSADVWETTYTHMLTGADPVLEWVARHRATARPRRHWTGTIRPAPTGRVRARVRRATARRPTRATAHGTLLEFRRIFAVGHKR